MLFIIALAITIILFARHGFTFRVFFGILMAFLAFAAFDNAFIAFAAYVLCAFPWSKWSKQIRNNGNNSSENCDSGNANTADSVQKYPSNHICTTPGNIYNIETVNINLAPQQQYLPQSAYSYDDCSDNREDEGWKITGVDWEALYEDMKSQRGF